MAWIYTRVMWVLEVIKLFLRLSPEMRSVSLIVVVLVSGAYYTTDYVSAKHQEVTEKIKTNESQMEEIIKSQAFILSEMKAISGSMRDVKDSVKAIDERVWQIGLDVYRIKNKNGG